jgi:hypothetical protein
MTWSVYCSTPNHVIASWRAVDSRQKVNELLVHFLEKPEGAQSSELPPLLSASKDVDFPQEVFPR